MGFWAIAGICVGVVVVGIALLCVLDIVSDSYWWSQHKIKRDAALLEKEKAKHPGKYKSKAFVEGYKEMAQWAGVKVVETQTRIDEEKMRPFRDNPYISRNTMRTLAEQYVVTETVCTLEFDQFNTPLAREWELTAIAYKVLDHGYQFDFSEALNSHKYLSTKDPEEFKQYYAGAIKFVSDVTEAEAKIADQRLENIRAQKVIEARKKGLREVGTRLSEDMRGLTEARTKLLSPESVEAQWERLMIEADKSCASDESVIG